MIACDLKEELIKIFSRFLDIIMAFKIDCIAVRLSMNSFLNQQVLVLNRLWQAVNVCTARRALTLLFEGQAQVVLNSTDGSFRTLARPVPARSSFREHQHHLFQNPRPTGDPIGSV